MTDTPVAILTGATGGIGRATASVLKRDGWRLFATGFGKAELLHKLLDADDFYADHDLANRSAPGEIVAAALNSLGRIDGLVHCAGTSHVAAFPDQEDEDWDRVMDINIGSAHRMARAVGRALVESRRGGAMIFISSIAWLSGGANPAYGAAKGGLNSLTFNIAQALGPHGVRANAIAPGIIDTDMVRGAFSGGAFDQLEKSATPHTPLRRLGTAEDVAEVAAFLMSPRAGFVTGAVIPVTGGLELLPPISKLAGDRA